MSTERTISLSIALKLAVMITQNLDFSVIASDPATKALGSLR